jgi:hypothetical protein
MSGSSTFAERTVAVWRAKELMVLVLLSSGLGVLLGSRVGKVLDLALSPLFCLDYPRIDLIEEYICYLGWLLVAMYKAWGMSTDAVEQKFGMSWMLQFSLFFVGLSPTHTTSRTPFPEPPSSFPPRCPPSVLFICKTTTASFWSVPFRPKGRFVALYRCGSVSFGGVLEVASGCVCGDVYGPAGADPVARPSVGHIAMQASHHAWVSRLHIA